MRVGGSRNFLADEFDGLAAVLPLPVSAKAHADQLRPVLVAPSFRAALSGRYVTNVPQVASTDQTKAFAGPVLRCRVNV
jgi:hypothetical protein